MDSRIRLSYHSRLFIMLLGFSWALVACFVLFQYHREKQYKADKLDAQLQLFNTHLLDALEADTAPAAATTAIPISSLPGIRGSKSRFTPSTPIQAPANRIISPSIDAEISSTFPCPKGCPASFGLAARCRLYSVMNPAVTFTILSSASVRIPTESVRKKATNLPTISTTDTATIPACTRCFTRPTVFITDKYTKKGPPPPRLAGSETNGSGRPAVFYEEKIERTNPYSSFLTLSTI